MTRARLIAGAIVVAVAVVAALAPGASAQITLPPPDAPPEPAVTVAPAAPPVAPTAPSAPAPSPPSASTGAPAPTTTAGPGGSDATDRLEGALARAQRRARAAARRRAAALRQDRGRLERQVRARARAALLDAGDGREALPRTGSSVGALSVMLLILGALALVGLPLILDKLSARSPTVTRTLQRGGVRLTLQAASVAIASAVVCAVIVLL